MKKNVSPNTHSFVYVLLGVLSVSIMLTNVLHNDLIDTLLTIFNTVLILMISGIGLKALFRSVNAICNP